MDKTAILVEIVYVPFNQPAIHRKLTMKPGATVEDSLLQSGLFESHPETKQLVVGIFGSRVPLTQLVKAGDRIELYRPLLMDPKEKRRQRALQK